MTGRGGSGGVPEAVSAWASVTPDGRINFWSLHPDRDGARFHTARQFMGPSYGSAEEGWATAESLGWRVVRVKIEAEKAPRDGAGE